MTYFTLGYRLPRFLSVPLFGDRERYGKVPQHDDPCWIEWEKTYLSFYDSTQKQSIGKIVNDAGYRVMRIVDLTGLNVLEVGPGSISHISQWRGMPRRYVIADIQESMIERSVETLTRHKVPYETRLVDREMEGQLPFEDEEFDLIVSFYTFEHLHPIASHITEMKRILKPGGQIIGAIPAEGGLAWGSGRFCTSRRWLMKNTTIVKDKIVCWEHPNFACQVLDCLDSLLQKNYVGYWPLIVPSIDANLVVKFGYQKSASS